MHAEKQSRNAASGNCQVIETTADLELCVVTHRRLTESVNSAAFVKQLRWELMGAPYKICELSSRASCK